MDYINLYFWKYTDPDLTVVDLRPWTSHEWNIDNGLEHNYRLPFSSNSTYPNRQALSYNLRLGFN